MNAFPVPHRRSRGFTLIEVLLATALLAAGLALAFGTLGAATKTVQRGELMAQRSERMRAVQGFLRRRIAAARPVAFDTDTASLLPQRFIGDSERMRFVADLPDYLGQGGPYLHDFSVDGGGQDGRILLTLGLVQSGETIEDRVPRPPEVLVEGLESARFRYRALDSEGKLGAWQEQWTAVEQLPLLIEVTLRDADGSQWPPLVVALPMATATAGAASANGEIL